MVSNEDELLAGMKFLIDNLSMATQYARRARQIVERNKGSSEAQASYIIKQLGEKS
jgi:hypothetical protein